MAIIRKCLCMPDNVLVKLWTLQIGASVKSGDY